jgi:hypothetical protein
MLLTSFRAPIVGMYHMLIVNSDGRVDGTYVRRVVVI